MAIVVVLRTGYQFSDGNGLLWRVSLPFRRVNLVVAHFAAAFVEFDINLRVSYCSLLRGRLKSHRLLSKKSSRVQTSYKRGVTVRANIRYKVLLD